MARRSLSGSRVVLTGASSGIGRSLALELAAAGAKVLAVARRKQLLEELVAAAGGPGAIEMVPGDITDAAFRAALMRRVQEQWNGLDVLINNAGVGALGYFDAADEDRLRRVMEVNFFALAEMIRAALPLLKQGRNPMVVNVSSVLGHRAVPTMSEYCASKFAVEGFSQSLRAEFVRFGIDLLVISPGSTQSEFFDNLLETQGEVLWPGRPRRSAEAVAADIVRAIRRGRRELVPSLSGRAFVWLNRAMPAILDRVLARRA